MEAWILQYLLILSYCITPEGQTVCEKTTQHIYFAYPDDCLNTRRQLIRLYEYSNIKVFEEESICKVFAAERDVYETQDEAKKAGQEKLDLFLSVEKQISK